MLLTYTNEPTFRKLVGCQLSFWLDFLDAVVIKANKYTIIVIIKIYKSTDS